MTALLRRTCMPKASAGAVDRAMRTLGLAGVRRDKGTRTTIPAKDGNRAGDLLDPAFTAEAPNRVWVTDFTYVKTWAGFVYVAFILDVYAQRIVAWHAATSKATELVMTPLRMALWQRDREGHPTVPGGLIHHSDAGSQGRPVESAQYASIRSTEHLELEDIRPSIGSIGDAYDNALMETINGLYKAECIRITVFHDAPFKTIADVEYATTGWVDWYNNRRLHSSPRHGPTSRARASPPRCPQPRAATRMRAAEDPGRFTRPAARTPGLAPKTVKNVHRMLHRALSDAVAWRYIEYNPAAHASLPRERRQRQRKKGATWTPEQLAAWLKVAVEDRDAGIWVLAATSGNAPLRTGRRAERSRLDLDAATLEIDDTRIVVAGQAEDSDGKSEAGVRVISLDPLTVVYLQHHLAMLDEERHSFGKSYDRSGKLVCHPDGRPIHPETITRRFNRLVDRAGVPLIRLHDVRHTYATVSLDAGVDPKIVSDRIGHANMGYTLAIYTHRSTGRDREAAETVAKLIFGEDWKLPAASGD